MNFLTCANCYLETWFGRMGRALSLDCDDGHSITATVPENVWRLVVSIALRDAPADLKQLVWKPLPKGPRAAASLPVCPDTLSLLRILQLIKGLDLPTAESVAKGWMEIPMLDRVSGHFTWLCPRVVHAQLLGLIEPSSPVIAGRSPPHFQDFIKAAQYAGLSSVSGMFWRTADTVLGSTCMAFVSEQTSQRVAYLAISDCKVSYQLMCGEARLEAHRAVQVLIDHLPMVRADDDALRLAGWDPSGHELMELVEFLEDLKTRIG